MTPWYTLLTVPVVVIVKIKNEIQIAKKKSFTFEKKKHIAKVNQTIDWLLITSLFGYTVQKLINLP